MVEYFTYVRLFIKFFIFILLLTHNLTLSQNNSSEANLTYPNIYANLNSYNDEYNFQKKDKKLFSYSFNADFFGEVSNKKSFARETSNYGYVLLNPNFSIYSVPFGAKIFLASNNTSSRQTINSISFYYDVEAAKALAYEETTEQIGQESFILKFFSYFISLEIGKAYPNFSLLSVQGASISGLSFEFNPGQFYLAMSLNNSQKPIDNLAFKRNFYAARLGVGRKESSHFIVGLLKSQDDRFSIRVDSSNLLLKPQDNFVANIDAKLSLLENRFQLEGEFAASFTNFDNTEPEIERDDMPGFLKELIKPKLSSSFDYAYNAKAVFISEEDNTKLESRIKMIGPGFVTVGNPGLRNDKFEIYGSVIQKFLTKRVTLGSSIRYNRDNLIGNKSFTTSSVMPSFQVALRFKDYPFLSLSFSPNYLWNDALDPSRKIDVKNFIYNVATGYVFKFEKTNFNTNFIYTLNVFNSLNSINRFKMNNFNLIESVTFRFPLTINLNTGLLIADYSWGQNSKTYSFDFNVGYLFYNSWNNFVGANFSTEPGSNRRLGFYISSAYSLEKNIDLDLRLERNKYTDQFFGYGSYTEFVVRSNARFKF